MSAEFRIKHAVTGWLRTARPDAYIITRKSDVDSQATAGVAIVADVISGPDEAAGGADSALVKIKTYSSVSYNFFGFDAGDGVYLQYSGLGWTAFCDVGEDGEELAEKLASLVNDNPELSRVSAEVTGTTLTLVAADDTALYSPMVRSYGPPVTPAFVGVQVKKAAVCDLFATLSVQAFSGNMDGPNCAYNALRDVMRFGRDPERLAAARQSRVSLIAPSDTRIQNLDHIAGGSWQSRAGMEIAVTLVDVAFAQSDPKFITAPTGTIEVR